MLLLPDLRKEAGLIDYVSFKGVKINNIDHQGIIRRIKEHLPEKAYICVADVGNVIWATQDEEMRKAHNSSFLSVADGMPLAWYARLSGCNRAARVTGVDLFRTILREENGFRHFLLGDTDNTIKEVIRKAKEANPALEITGYSPPFKKVFSEQDNRLIFSKINKYRPDIIWVSFGGIKQDKWMYHNLPYLRQGVMIGVGAAFRFYIGQLKMPPKIVQNLGLQWLSRMIQTPEFRRLKTIQERVTFLFHFPWEVLKSRIKGVCNCE